MMLDFVLHEGGDGSEVANTWVIRRVQKPAKTFFASSSPRGDADSFP
jgi:hypothetical protein